MMTPRVIWEALANRPRRSLDADFFGNPITLRYASMAAI